VALTEEVYSLSAGVDCDFVLRSGEISNRLNLYLLCIAVLFSLYDTVSTILSVKTVGYSYEGNIFIREIIHSSGALGLIGIKFSVTFLALSTTYYIIKHKDNFGWKNVKMFYGIYAGTIISSFFAATSNLSVVYAGSSFYFLNFNSLQISAFLLLISPLAGFFLDMQSIQRDSLMQQRKKAITRSGSILITYVNYLYSFRDVGKSMIKK